jgi:hypothetical protein
MYLRKFFEDEDLQRYKREKEDARQKEISRLKSANSGLDSETIERIAKEVADKAPIAPPKLAYVSLAHTGFEAQQNFSAKLVTELVKAGIMKLSGDELTLTVMTDGGFMDLSYEVLLKPGRYCLHCDEKLDDDPGGTLARLHMATNHNGIPSPVPDEPSGYVWNTGFICRLDEQQHTQYKVRRPGAVYSFAEMED